MKDYKHRVPEPKAERVHRKPRKRKPTSRKKANATVPAWRWGLVLVIIATFGYFLYSLSTSLESEQDDGESLAAPRTIAKPLKTVVKKPQPKTKTTKPKKVTPVKKTEDEIQYDFYTVLPNTEFVVPEHEVKTRKREERVGKLKAGASYFVQAGAFRSHKDADRLKAKLLLMGFLPKIEKALIGSVTWYRVKMGPYKQLISVDAILAKLKQNKMDALVIQLKK